MLECLCASLSMIVGTVPRPDVVGRFQVQHCRVDQESVRFRLYRPDVKQPLPLIIWLHGRGEAGDNNQDQLAWLELILTDREQAFPGYILAHAKTVISSRLVAEQRGGRSAADSYRRCRRCNQPLSHRS